MSSDAHTFGPTCIFHDEDDDGRSTPSADSLQPPPIKAQFFYVSALPLDDPLSPLPPISSDPKIAQNHRPQPFSVRDNAALAEAWQSTEYSRNRASEKSKENSQRPPVGERGTTLGELIRFPRFAGDGSSPPSKSYLAQENQISTRHEASQDTMMTTTGLRGRLGAPWSPSQGSPRSHLDELETPSSTISRASSQRKRRRFSPFRKGSKAVNCADEAPTSPPHLISAADQTVDDSSCQPSAQSSISVSSLEIRSKHQRKQGPSYVSDQTGQLHREPNGSLPTPYNQSELPSKLQSPNRSVRGADEDIPEEKTLIPVGVSRLHLVEMPDLILKPIYWSPVNDVSAVLRGTWFYTKSMLPVESELANWLETGYQELRPWTQTWQDELNSCVEIGAEAEMKAVYHLFPNHKSSLSGTGTDSTNISSDVQGRAHPSPQKTRVTHGTMAAGPQSDKFRPPETCSSQRFRNHRVVYINSTDAQVLRPSLAPSVSRNRRPLAAVRKGREIGVPVCRGFNRRSWLKSNPPAKMNRRAAHAAVGAYISQSGDAGTQERHVLCPACKIEQQKRTPRVTDLVLVIHGIGQKLSERMDSFNFTHAINSFRREVNVELSSEVIRGNIRKEQGGIMVLPVNWRLTVSFDDGAESKESEDDNRFQLDDITPESLPAIRSLISDVMLDIPYYLSHHKQKMISAVIREANRVYRLWCGNNPGFHDSGRVHLIAHSLGSVMAMDILSQQPTVPPALNDVLPEAANDKVFEFDTKSLFSCGSPAGFFLLLNKANLVPRKGRRKPGAEDEADGSFTGESGKFGCLAIDNIYNVMAPYDPISYCVNAAVDSKYAATLSPAVIPSARQGFLASIGLKWGAAGAERSLGLAAGPPSARTERPTMNKLPSTIEMDTHNFTREEVAEKRMYLLNDNGQIDFTLSSDGGPLDFQYWNMLGAHSSYWQRQDFVRFLVVEIGRERGRQGTLSGLRATKKHVYKAGKIM